MRPITAPTLRSKVETGHTRGSIAYAAALRALSTDFSILLTRSQEVERVAAEVELWAGALGGRLNVVVLPALQKIEEEGDEDELMLQREEKSVEVLGVLGEITAHLTTGKLFDFHQQMNSVASAARQFQSAANAPPGGISKSQKISIILVADLDALTQPLPGNLKTVEVRRGQRISLEELRGKLGGELGYSHEALCEAPGQFAIRGGIVDIYPPNAQAPVRVDFFGDEIEALKSFDPTTQRTLAPPFHSLENIFLGPARADSSWKSGGLMGYLPPKVNWIVMEPSELEAAHVEHFRVPEKIAVAAGHFVNFAERPADEWLGLCRLNTPSEFFANAEVTEVLVETPAKYRPLPGAGLIGEERAHTEKEMLRIFVNKAADWGAHAFVFSRGEAAQEFQKVLTPLHATFVHGAISEGFILREGHTEDSMADASFPPGEEADRPHGGAGTEKWEKCVLALAPSDLPPYASVYTLSRMGRRRAHRSAVNELLDFSQVAEGDFLVHLEHGICRYRGIGKTDEGDEVLSLEFDEGIMLHLRFSEAHLISRYVGLTKKQPRLSRLGSQGWAKAKKNAQQATMDYAAELLRLQAVRTHEPGFAFAPDSDLTHQFDATFPYRLTADQAKAIEATKTDMMSSKPMDRLVCGDVGFGKTEVALRAAMKAVESGKQVCVLCPTTILSQQHYSTFNERAAGFGVVVECLNRFRSHKEQYAILKGIEAGKIDIVVGTHRLLSHDVKFRDLGLIVIDEEHRFGVEQKEKLKRLRTYVDVLAMSATPIPRTLQMALGGARDLSIIETAPQNRRPIETIVKTFDEKLLREAIEYEVSRGGQVFYLHNRVRTIARVALRLREMFPTLRVAVGHGKMPEEELEQVMTDFVAGRHDLLVCTTIIESGLDIPNCNTLIIEGADQFGLAQLYQIRGRVGRFNRQAYAYLFLHKNKEIAGEAKNRLEALRVHNELGAGFRIAMRDLELRGSGNLLGPQQSGHVAGIGFELYCELLKESVQKLKSSAKGKTFVPRTTVRFDFPFDTRISGSYLPEARLRLELNRELSLCETLEDFKELGESVADRFGPPPPSVKRLLEMNELRILAHNAGFISLNTEGDRLKLMRPDGSYLKEGVFFPRLGGETPGQKIHAIREILDFRSAAISR